MRGVKVTGSGPNPGGFCMCGCGAKAPLAKRGHRRSGHVAGKPVRFIVGHTARLQDHGPDYRVDAATGCWEWLKYKTKHGYGRKTLYAEGEAPLVLFAHRWVYEQHVGPIPEGRDLDHLCRNPSCVNPSHLEPVTHAENIRRGATAKLGWDDVRAIRAASSDIAHTTLARQFGVSDSQIARVRLGSRWQETA